MKLEVDLLTVFEKVKLCREMLRESPGIQEDEALAEVDAFPGKVFHGTITQLGSRAEFTPRNVQTKKSRIKQVFGVKIKLDNTEGLLRPGMNMDVTLKPKTTGKP